MERIGTMTAQTAQPPSTTSGTSLSRASNPDTYREAVLLVVIDSFEASSQNATLEEQMQRANVWTDLLIDIVPENRLQDVFRKAFRDHKSSFPINAYELKDAWDQINQQEILERNRELYRDQRENPVRYCPASWNHINEEGDIAVYLGVPPNGKEVVVPCERCRAAAFYQRYDEERARFVTERPEAAEVLNKSIIDVVFDMFQEAQATNNNRPKATTAVSILIDARLSGGNHSILTNAIAYVQKMRKLEA